jgi:lipocalin
MDNFSLPHRQGKWIELAAVGHTYNMNGKKEMLAKFSW